MAKKQYYNHIVNNCSRYINFEDACIKIIKKIEKEIELFSLSVHTTPAKKIYYLFELKEDCYYNVSKEKIEELTKMKFQNNVALELHFHNATLCLSIICKF